jgi:hypothetical protein
MIKTCDEDYLEDGETQASDVENNHRRQNDVEGILMGQKSKHQRIERLCPRLQPPLARNGNPI